MPYNCAYVFSVIMDNKRALTWVDRLISSEIIDEKNPYSQTVYVAMDSPFPFVDREFVYNREYTFDDENDTIFVKIISVDREIKGQQKASGHNTPFLPAICIARRRRSVSS